MMINTEKKYKILFFSCLFLLFGICIYIFFVKENKRIEKSSSEILVDNISFLKSYELESEGVNLSPELIVKDEHGQKAYLRDIVKNDGKILVYRFLETHCDLCVIQQLRILKDLSNETNLENLILLSGYSNTKKSHILKQAHDLNFRIFNIMEDIGIPLEKTSNPYFFIIHKDLKCSDFFSVIKETPQLTISCLETVINKLNK